MFFLEHWKAVVSLLVAVILCGYIAVLTIERDDARRSLKDAKAQIELIHQESAQIKAEAIRKNAEIAEHDKQINEGLANDYASTLRAIRARDSGISCRMREPANLGSGSVSNNPAPSISPDATTADRVANLPRDCAITTAQVIGLQKYVREICH